MSDDAIQFAERLRDAGLDLERFIDVQDGTKKPIDHTKYGPESVSGNYGIYANGADLGGLIDVDIDDYDEGVDEDALAAVNDLPTTLTVETPHTDGVTGGHRFYAVEPGEEFATAQEACMAVCGGTPNPSPSWGEVRVNNQYVVGPGSRLDGCDKAHCDKCSEPGGGWYEIAADLPIATITADDLANVLRSDPGYEPEEDVTEETEVVDLTVRGQKHETDGVQHRDGDGDYPDPAVVVAATDVAKDYPHNGDRSEHDWAICKVFARHGVPKGVAERWFRNHLPESKVVDRGDIDYGRNGGGTWTRAVEEVRKEDGAVGTLDVTEITPGTWFSVPREWTDGLDTRNDGDDVDDWDFVRQMYDANDAPKRVARDYAFNLLNAHEHFLAVQDTEELYRYVPDQGIYRPNGEQRVGEITDRRLGSFYSTHERNQLVSRTKDRTWTDREELGGPEGLVCVANGVLDLTDPVKPDLRDHDPAHRFIATLPIDAEPVEPDTFDHNEEYPEFAAFLDGVVRDEDRAKLQEYAGYCLHTWGQPFKRALVCLGPTDSGKSTFLSILSAILGPENVANESLGTLLQSRWGTANLFGTFANIRNELSSGDLTKPHRFKEITSGQDAIDAERKGKDKFTFVPTAKHLFASNQIPSVLAKDEAFYN